MAKKKVQKEEKSKFNYSSEIEGVILIILSMIGLGSYGIIGSIMSKFAIFMFGSWYKILLVSGLLIGLYLIINRKNANLFSARLIGIYFIICAVLIFSHLNYIQSDSGNLVGKEIFVETYNKILESYEDTASIRQTGGGIVGALFTWGLVSLFDIDGTNIVVIVLALFGIVMLFDLTLGDIFRAIINAVKKIFAKEEKVKIKDTIEPEEDNDIEDSIGSLEPKKVVITSMDDLPSITEHKEEVKINKDTNIEPIKMSSNNSSYIKPSIDLLNRSKNKSKNSNNEVISSNTKILERVFGDFGIKAKVVEAHVGPSVTQYELAVERGTRVSKITSMSKEIGLALAAKEVRIEAPIPGKNTIGIEIANVEIMSVSMREMMENIPSKYSESKLLAPLGRDIMGNVKYVEINKTPHMLVAGATGSGKSVCINNIILSLIMRTTPEEVKMVLVDPKKVEFSVYENMPHLLLPVVTDPKKANVTLQKIVIEMDERYEIFKNSLTKNITGYNEYVENKLKKDPNCGLTKMPYIVVIIDELADLMLVAAKEVEESIMRITQLARAAGIHLIVATQRPSADVITGVVKANIPTRVSFAVSSSIDSRTILDMTGAEKLLGKGDMLYKPMDDNIPTRIQGSFVGDDEIKRVVEFAKKGGSAPVYDEKYTNLETASIPGNSSDEKDKDVLYDQVLEYAITNGTISASLIQRRFSIGYNRAARLIETFEEQGLVGPAKGSKPRDVLVKMGGE